MVGTAHYRLSLDCRFDRSGLPDRHPLRLVVTMEMSQLPAWTDTGRQLCAARTAREKVCSENRQMPPARERISGASKGPVIVDGLCLNHLIPQPMFGRGFRIYVRSEGHGDGRTDEIDRRRDLGTNLYHRRHNPEATADLVITVPYEF
jgi:hypothetical protein